MKIGDALRQGTHLLTQAGSEEANLEAELLLGHALGLDRVHLYQRLRNELPPERERAYRALLERRLAHEPTAYIVGHKEFYGLDFEVTPAAIIPRPETEVLVELALAFARERFAGSPFPLADVGVGCGAIAVSIASELPQAEVIASDLSPQALALAQGNAQRQRLAERILFLQGDLLEPLDAHPEPVEGPAHPEPKPGDSRDSSRRVDIIAANLPYVPTADWERMPPEIRNHEPRGGLDGGPDGLRAIERLLRQAPHYLKPGGALFVEIGDEQGQAATKLARHAFPKARIEVRPDLSGLDRVLVVQDVE